MCMSENRCDRHTYSPGISIKMCMCGSVKAIVSPWKSNATQLLLQAALWCQVIKQSAFIPRKSKEFLEWLHLYLTNSLWYILFFSYKISMGLESLLAWALNFIGNVLTSQYCNRKPGKGMKGEKSICREASSINEQGLIKKQTTFPTHQPFGNCLSAGYRGLCNPFGYLLPVKYYKHSLNLDIKYQRSKIHTEVQWDTVRWKNVFPPHSEK